MSLRIRLFLIFGALVALLVGAHGFLVRSLAAELKSELDVVALDVGASVARALAEIGPPCEGAPCAGSAPVEVLHFGPQDLAGGATWSDRQVEVSEDGGPGKRTERHVVRRIVRRGAATAGAAPSPGDPAAGDPAAGGPGGYAYFFSHGGEAGGVVAGAGAAGPGKETETLVIRLGDGAQGALQLRGPGLAAEVPIPRLGLEEKLARFERRVLLGSLLLLAAGLLAAALLAHRVSAPLVRLSRAAVAVGDGQLGLTVDERAGAAELRQALGAFNRMSARLRELAGQNRRLQQERHLGEIGEIARGLAHSLRNPLHALGLSVGELAQRAGGGRDDEEGVLLAAAKRQIGRLDRSIRSFLVFASRTGVEAQPVDFGALAADVALEALQDQQAGVRISVATTDEPGPEENALLPRSSPRRRPGPSPQSPSPDPDEDWVPASAGMTVGQLRPGEPGEISGAFSEQGSLNILAVEQELRAMVQALVVNAVEASPPGGQVVVRVGRDPDAERWWLEVDDEGPGIAPEIRERLFTPHVTTKASGSGMGLFLAQRLAAGRYDGKVELLPRDSGGTRARLELGPRIAAEDAP